MLTKEDGGVGWGLWIPPKLADMICEQLLLDEFLLIRTNMLQPFVDKSKV